MRKLIYILMAFVTASFYVASQDLDFSEVEIEGYIGVIYQNRPGSQFTYYFERNNGDIYGIYYTDSTYTAYEDALYNNSLIKISGTLTQGIIAPGGQCIRIKKLEVIKKRTTKYRSYSHLIEPAESSSYLDNTVNKYEYVEYYPPWDAQDGDLNTSWVEGVPGPGIGEWIIMPFVETLPVKEIGISIGYDENDKLFFANNRVKTLKISINGNKFLMNHTFPDKRGIQHITFDEPIDANSLTFEIVEVYPGTKYDDTCISEIQVWGLY